MMKFLLIGIMWLIVGVAQGQGPSMVNEPRNIYGGECGAYGTTPVLRDITEKWIETENVVMLIDWLSGKNLVKQVYASEGLIRLQNSGITLSVEQRAQINRLKKSKELVTVCNGCMTEQEKIRRLLKHFKLKKKR